MTSPGTRTKGRAFNRALERDTGERAFGVDTEIGRLDSDHEPGVGERRIAP